MSSTYTNANFPAPSTQVNYTNGLKPQTRQQQQTTPELTHSQQQQDQQILLQKLQQQPQQQQQQQQLTRIQQQVQLQQLQQQPLVPGGANNTNLNKFLPPSTTINKTTNVPLVNGLSHPPIAQSLANNLPPHLRQPIQNGGGGLGAADNVAFLGASDLSSQSSRTSSPALQNLPPTQQSLRQQPYQAGQHPPNIQQSSIVPPQGRPPATILPSANVGALNDNMKNLNINQMNNAPPPPLSTATSSTLQTPLSRATAPNPTNTSQPTSFPPNFQGQFKTAALNSGPINSNIMNPNVASAGIYGKSTAPPMMGQNFPPTPFQQNALNNNSNPAIPNEQRKPMYPPTIQNYSQVYQQQQSSMMPPTLQQQQQQQQPQQQQYQQPHLQQQLQPYQQQLQQASMQNRQSYQYANQAPNNPNTYNQSVISQGFNTLWGQDSLDLMQNRHILMPATLVPPKIVLHNQFHESINCNPDIIRSTIAKIPESNSLLQKSRLPLGILLHPFRDINNLPVIQCPNIVRCRLCRTYINPFIYFVDSKMWKCNLCYRVNELPDDFQFDPATKTYGDVTRRPEVRSSTIEFIAPSEYMLRPPQPAVYLFLFDVSIIAQQSGYLENVCAVLSEHLEDMPGDARTRVGFIAYNSQVHFYALAESYNQPHEMTLIDIDDPFIPRPDNLLVNLKECKELVKDLLALLPNRFADTHDPGSAMGSALQCAYKLMQASGGRVTVFQTCLPKLGPGALQPREDPNNRSAKDVAHLNPATDFYKRFALECSGYQIAVDLFILNQQYTDLATLSGISKHSGGCVFHFPLYQKTKSHNVDALKNSLKRYLVRKIGFEAVMRIRCTRGLQVHTFHGNFFVRSTDLLSLPNVNPDAGYGMQISYEESLTDVKTVCFQAALLYTNSEGERRIRVHTICLPVTSSLSEVMHAADTEAIIGLLAKMAVDRSITSSMADAREAFINATVDVLSAFKIAQNLPSGQTGQLIAPKSLALMPMYILALLKHPAFRIGTSTRLDDRVYAMDCMKSLPLDQLMKFIYPEFYKLDSLFLQKENSNINLTEENDDEIELPDLTQLQLSAEHLDARSVFLIDAGTLVIIYIGMNVPTKILENAFGVKSTAEIPDYSYGIPSLKTVENAILKCFVRRQNDEKPYPPVIQIIRDTSTAKPQFMEYLVDDRSESSLSYYEFLQHLRTQVK